jgi:hypothetical protein
MLRNNASGPEIGLRAGFWPDYYRESTEMGPRPAEGRPEERFPRLPGSSPAKIWPGMPFSGPEALNYDIPLHNTESLFKPY